VPRPLSFVLLVVIALIGSTTSCSPSATDHTVHNPGYSGPTVPAEVGLTGPDGALAYARHYLATYNYARRSGDLNGLVPLEAVDCGTCQALRHELAGIYDNGGRIDGGAWKLAKPVASESTPIDGWVIAATARIAPTVIHRPGKKPERTPGSATRITFEISRTTGTWKVLLCDKSG